MTSLSLCGLALLVTYLAARRSLCAGLLATLAVGYVYGIARANFPDGYSYFLFDAAVLGLYGGQLFSTLDRSEHLRLRQLQTWVIVLIAWPVLLLLFPFQDPLIRLVGLRGGIFFLPFLLLGARLQARDLYKVALGIAVLNLCAAALAGVEFFVGIERFFPRNATTEIIYLSNDLLHFTTYRIPSSFPNAHAYAGTMVMTMPLLLGAWQLTRRPLWQGLLIAGALLASALGVFMAASRSHAIVLFLMALMMTVITFTNRSQSAYRLRWLILLGCVGWAVSADGRLQRFTTLSDAEYVGRRFAGSVNMTFFDVISTYPIGNGLGGGGTSVPYFLQDRLEHPVGMENEYARIALEQGVPGLCLWVAFMTWVFVRALRVRTDAWYLARRLAWLVCAADFGLGLTGTGLFTSVPQTCLMLVSLGWIAVPSPLPQRQRAIVGHQPRMSKLFAAQRA
jgi:hypothetical protein